MARISPDDLAGRLRRVTKGMIPAAAKGMETAGLLVETKAKENCSPDTTPYDEAPFDTGTLRSEISHEVKVEGTSVTGIVKSPTAYAIPVHEGTSKMTGRPYLSDAVTECGPKVEKIMADALGPVVEGA